MVLTGSEAKSSQKFTNQKSHALTATWTLYSSEERGFKKQIFVKNKKNVGDYEPVISGHESCPSGCPAL